MYPFKDHMFAILDLDTLEDKGNKYQEYEFNWYPDFLDRIQGIKADFSLLKKLT